VKTCALIAVEVRRFFTLTWNLRLAVLLVPAVWLALWEHMPSPFIPIIAVLFVGLEPQYCNIMFRTPNEFEALSVMPVHWKHIVLAKNLSTVLITLLCLPIVSILVLYFSPDIVPAEHFWKTGLYLVSVIFPLLHTGNLQSLAHPRRHLGWRMDDLAGGILVTAFLAVFSLPYLLLVEAAGVPLLCLLYGGAAGYFWFRHSLKETARRITQPANALCTPR
jgi:hypothetical protein